MSRNPALLYKSLVALVVVLFIGVGIQPAFAITPNTSSSKEDCNCEELNNYELVKVERLLNKAEVYSKFLSVLSKYNPETKDEIGKLSDKISTLKEELADETALPTICFILERIYEISKDVYLFFEELIYSFTSYFSLALILASMCLGITNLIKFNIFFIGQLLSCWEWPGPPTGTLIVKVLDTQGGTPQDGVTVEIKNETHTIATNTCANGKAYFLFTSYKIYDVYVNFIFAETVDFHQQKLEVEYYLDELMDYRSRNLLGVC